MSTLEIIVGVILIAVLFAAIRAAYVLRRNPHQQIKEHEDLAGRFRAHVTMAEKLSRMNLRGISPSQSGRIWRVALVVVLCFVFFLWRYR